MAITRPSKPIPLGMQTADIAGSRFSGSDAHLHERRSETCWHRTGYPARRDLTLTTRTRATWRAAALTAYFFFFGASTMIIWRPSIFGICST